jgi:hypothetical protein
MMGAPRVRPLGWLGVLGATSAISLASPGASLAASEKEYSVMSEPACVLAPGTLNISAKLKMTVTGMAPSELNGGEQFSLKNTSITVRAPISVTELFASQEASEVKGLLSKLLIAALGAQPASTNIARPSEFPEGLLFVAPVEKGKELVLHIPSKLLGETSLTYAAGAWRVRQITGLVRLSVDSEPALEEVEGFKEGAHVIGPISAACTGAGGTLAEIPILPPQGEHIEHPEMYTNSIGMTTSHVGLIGWGPFKLAARGLGEEVECVAQGFGTSWNEGSPGVGHGQVLSFGAAGDATSVGTEASRSCKFKQGTSEGLEAWVTTAPALNERRQSGALSVPWNTQLVCIARLEEVLAPSLEVGIPNGAPTTTGCHGEAEQAAANAKEEEERRGCYSTTVPEGCIKVNVVVPAAAQELVFEGTLRPDWRNGFTTGVKPSVVELSGAADEGTLRLAGAFATSAAVTGRADAIGFGSIQLLTAK